MVARIAISGILEKVHSHTSDVFSHAKKRYLNTTKVPLVNKILAIYIWCPCIGFISRPESDVETECKTISVIINNDDDQNNLTKHRLET